MNREVNIGMLGTVINNGNMGCVALTYSLVTMLEKVSNHLGVDFVYNIFDMFPEEEKKKLMCTNLKIEEKKIHVFKQGYVGDFKAKIRFFLDNRVMINKIKKCDVIIDMTAGDSFTDIYGRDAFYSVAKIKMLVERIGVPLILGPQTYGPFTQKKHEVLAKKVIEKANLVIARDLMSKVYVEEFTDIKIEETTDLAFGLPYKKSQNMETGEKLKIGINISALLVEDKKENTNVDFVLKTDYDTFMDNILTWFGQFQERYEVYLVPHVVEDVISIREYEQKYPYVNTCNMFLTPIEAKNFIATLDVFIGSRMHATIAAASAGVPTIPIAYSRKFKGLFDSINYPYVVDLQEVDTNRAVELTKLYLGQRKEMKKALVESSQYVSQKMQKTFELLCDYFEKNVDFE